MLLSKLQGMKTGNNTSTSLVEDTYSASREENLWISFPRQTSCNIPMLVKGSERNVRSPDIPDVDATVDN